MPEVAPQQAEPPLVIALDAGTSSVRAILFDGRCRKVAGVAAKASYAMRTTGDGGVEMGADELCGYIARTLDDLLARFAAQFPSPPPIEAVAMCTLWHALLGLDEMGRPVTPLFSWNDTRAAGAAWRLRREIDESIAHARTGCLLRANYWPAKIVWLRETQPDVFDLARWWASIGEYFHLKLFGALRYSVSMASGTGLLRQADAVWDEELAAQCGIAPETLPPLVDADEGFGGLKDEYARRWPALRDARWFAALGDGACANLGSGCVTRERFALTVGTSGAMRVLFEGPAETAPCGLWQYRIDRRRPVIGGALSDGGNLFAWMRATLRLEAETEAELAAMEPDSHGLTVLPFLAGERSTGWHDRARAAVAGMSLDTTPAELLRAGLEAVAYRFAAIEELLSGAVGEPREVWASGGALLRSPVWAQIISDVLGRAVFAAAEAEASSRGAALRALEAMLGPAGPDFLQVVKERVYEPDARHHEIYKAARLRHERLYDALIENEEMGDSLYTARNAAGRQNPT